MTILQVSLELWLLFRSSTGAIFLNINAAQFLRFVAMGVDLNGVLTGHVALLRSGFRGNGELVLLGAHTGPRMGAMTS